MKRKSLKIIILMIGMLKLATPQTTPANVFVDGVCICVTQNYCGLAGGGGSPDGSGQLDPRIMTVKLRIYSSSKFLSF